MNQAVPNIHNFCRGAALEDKINEKSKDPSFAPPGKPGSNPTAAAFKATTLVG
jgi:hypothetical protein